MSLISVCLLTSQDLWASVNSEWESICLCCTFPHFSKVLGKMLQSILSWLAAELEEVVGLSLHKAEEGRNGKGVWMSTHKVVIYFFDKTTVWGLIDFYFSLCVPCASLILMHSVLWVCFNIRWLTINCMAAALNLTAQSTESLKNSLLNWSAWPDLWEFCPVLSSESGVVRNQGNHFFPVAVIKAWRDWVRLDLSSSYAVGPWITNMETAWHLYLHWIMP